MVNVYVTSAFSKNNGGGNKAGVVLDRQDLTEQQKMEISRILGYSETAFVTASEKADYKLEYFTPTEEVPLCGHATIATFATLHLLGRLKSNDCTIETKAGILDIHVDDDGLVMMQQNRPEYYDMIEPAEVGSSLGADGAQVMKEHAPIQIISTGLRDIILPVKDEDALNAFTPDFAEMTRFSREKDVVGIHAFAIPSKNASLEGTAVDAVCRNFAPLYGIDEESATGTASCALAGYFAKYLYKKERYIFEQGYSMNLPSRIMVQVTYDQEHQDQIDKIYVGGYGYLVEGKELFILQV